ncbi:MAG: glycosyltransferase family 4 protein [Phycisphaerae bacterium]|nr:glycosyltransferase family 4 protein [Phycisphaerae bacterium]
MLNYEYPPLGGGAAQAHQHLLKEYARRNDLWVDVLTAAETPQFRMETLTENVRLYRLGLHKKNRHYWRKSEVVEWLFKANQYYKKLLHENSYDLVHAFFAFPSAYPCLKTAGRIPYIVSLRGSDVPGFNVRLKLDYVLLSGLFRRIWKNASAVIANSRGLAELARRFEPSLDYAVIPNGVDTDLFSPPASRTLSGRIKLLTVCRLISRKRIDLQIETLDRLLKNQVDAELNIVGDGNLEAPLRTLAQSLGIADRVHFHGLLDFDQLPAVYRANHLFLMTSQHEGMSNAMLEAMASGLPVITAPCEGVAELIDHNGIVVPQPSPNELAAAIAELLAQPDRYAAMNRAAADKARQFSWAAVADQYVEHYRRIAAEK